MKKYYVFVSGNGSVFWHKDKECRILHREDGPAVEYADGGKSWYKDNELHREDGPAVEYPDGSKEWYVNGKRHREDGPAIDGALAKSWWVNGKRHREDGPAIEWAYGTKQWYLDHHLLTEEEFLKRIQPVEELTVAQIEQLLGKRVKIIK